MCSIGRQVIMWPFFSVVIGYLSSTGPISAILLAAWIGAQVHYILLMLYTKFEMEWFKGS